MDAGEATGALLLLLAAAAAVAAAVATGAVDFTYVATVGSVGPPPSSSGGEWGEVLWARVRSRAVAPALQVVVWACMVMSVMLVVEATYNCAVSVGVMLLGWKPERRFKWEPLGSGAGDDDEEKGDTAAAAAAAAAYPMVMVQIPMYNELEVYKLSIGAACELKWPKERLIVQVLDDSTDPCIKKLVEKECVNWASKGLNVKYATRTGHKGFKAGALKKGMEWDYAKQCEYVALFDADYQPEPDFLLRTVPFLMNNENVALVQARWVFVLGDIFLFLKFTVNDRASLLTRIQRTFLDYHFKVEQEAGSATFSFFSFNGTAGVWRTEAINDAGGWKDRTTVEDMDLAVRATLKGWKFIYVGDVRVKSELPFTYEAYRRQQFRWACGSANLFRKMIWEVFVAKQVSPLKKFYMIYSFFLVRRVVAPTVTFVLYNIIIPVSVMVPEVFLPIWGVAYIPTALTVVTAVRNPENLHIMPLWILFESVMSMHRLKAAIAGLLELPEFNQWIVTKKVGNNGTEENSDVPLLQKARKGLRNRVNLPEIGFSVFLFTCASYNLVFHGKTSYFINIYLQGLAFLLLGLNGIGTSYCCL
ncbi:hypothetical protein U9M48_007549 [Paspalum notatum var. saurae]|uniref:glucomannan 4-beta-mannosyltransferase n=1 Tax=Paspalum notatum var. saurae TaxID=547442 RepID=A0AAQ3Q0B3_PASNO